MKVALVNYEEHHGLNGILSKYAYKMEEELKKLGVKATVTKKPVGSFDINHHINYFSYIPSTAIDTLQITHITNEVKMYSVVKGMKTAKAGICFSHETEEQLKKEGVKNLHTILPAHDAYPRKPKKIFISTNVYPDGCKREWMFPELLKKIDPSQFVFFIMGKNWKLDGLNATINYLDHFELADYPMMMDQCDYMLYFGEDEGSMAILDAANVGLQTIAPNVGFHKEIGIDHPFSSLEELVNIFKRLQTNPVADWTWENYAKQHKTLWQKLLKGR